MFFLKIRFFLKVSFDNWLCTFSSLRCPKSMTKFVKLAWMVIWHHQWLGSASTSARISWSRVIHIRVMQMSSLVSETANQKGGNYSLLCPKPFSRTHTKREIPTCKRKYLWIVSSSHVRSSRTQDEFRTQTMGAITIGWNEPETEQMWVT